MRDLTEEEYRKLSLESLIVISDGTNKYQVEICRDSIHYARAYLLEGDKTIYHKFVCAPKNIDERKSINVQAVLFYHGFSLPFCFFCGTQEPSKYESFEIDHILQLKDGGIDDVKNTMLLCTRCHKLKNWNNTYVVRHLENNKRV